MAYIVAGFGHFGRLACRRITAAFPNERLIIVERNPEKIEPTTGSNAILIEEEIVSYLIRASDIFPDDWIVPMVPFHMAATYALERLPDARVGSIPDGLEVALPNAFPVAEHTLTCSYATCMCPDDCAEEDVCPVTGERRDVPLHRAIASLNVADTTVLVLTSRQILPGVGGYQAGDLFDLVRRLNPGRFLIATACRCHGVITCIERQP